MIIDKKNNNVISDNRGSVLAKPSHNGELVEVPIQVESNGPIDVLTAIKTILKEVTWEYGVPNSPKIFKTVQLDDGQYERIIHPNANREETIAFPAAFCHFIGWHYLAQANRISEGRAELRIRFILNNLNPHDEKHEMDIFYVAERINQSIQDAKKKYTCLQSRCDLTYIDPMESFDRSLQPCWMTYEVWFKQMDIWKRRNIIRKKFVFPPFTNHSDQKENQTVHTNSAHPRSYDEATKYIDKGQSSL